MLVTPLASRLDFVGDARAEFGLEHGHDVLPHPHPEEAAVEVVRVFPDRESLRRAGGAGRR